MCIVIDTISVFNIRHHSLVPTTDMGAPDCIDRKSTQQSGNAALMPLNGTEMDHVHSAENRPD
jgi:hypothetical protein